MKKHSLVLRSSIMENLVSWVSNSVLFSVLYLFYYPLVMFPAILYPIPWWGGFGKCDSDCRKNKTLGFFGKMCVHGPQCSTSYSFLNGIDVALRHFCSWFSPSKCFPLCNIKAGESENKDLKMLNSEVEWSEFNAGKKR